MHQLMLLFICAWRTCSRSLHRNCLTGGLCTQSCKESTQPSGYHVTPKQCHNLMVEGMGWMMMLKMCILRTCQGFYIVLDEASTCMVHLQAVNVSLTDTQVTKTQYKVHSGNVIAYRLSIVLSKGHFQAVTNHVSCTQKTADLQYNGKTNIDSLH